MTEQEDTRLCNTVHMGSSESQPDSTLPDYCVQRSFLKADTCRRYPFIKGFLSRAKRRREP